MIISIMLALASGEPPALDSISPPAQRVHEMITLRGAGFGLYDPGVSQVVFTDAADPVNTVEGGTPYVWRDDFIQLRVPVQFPDTAMLLHVVTAGGSSETLPFNVITAPGATLTFVERTEIVAQHDVSTFLGSPNMNLARTKNGEIGDVNGDGYPDLLDDNSNNLTNGTFAVLRLNDRGRGFDTMAFEPRNAGDVGEFATTVPPSGDFVGDSIVYDGDLVDLNNDGLVDRVQAATEFGTDTRVRVALNNNLGVPGRFIENTSAWFPEGDGFTGSPDDIAHTDVNHDGFIDIGVAYRTTDTAVIYLNLGGVTFASPIVIEATGSIHDVFFVDADDDGWKDIVLVNESGSCEIHMNQGGTDPDFVFHSTLPMNATSGVPADLNGDGVEDFALVEISGAAQVFLNDPVSPGTFTQVPLPDGVFGFYDLEAGDVDLDGSVDLISPAIIFGGGGDDTARVWLNSGTGTFINATSPGASDLFPGIAAFQRLSAALLDYDLDGDLDFYITGADGTGVKSFGDVPNQFFENLIDPDLPGVPGDVTGDGMVDVEDLVAVILAWGPCPAPCPEDIDGDGVVDVEDLVVVILNWS